MRKKILLFWLILLIGFPVSVYASVRVTPVVSQLNISTGEEKSDFFSVQNTGDELVTIEVELEELLREETDTEGINVDSWLEVEPRRFNIASGQEKRVMYKVNVPEDGEGELRARVFFTTGVTSKGTIGIKKRFGVAVYVAIQGTEIVEAEITGVSVSGIGPGTKGDFKGGMKIGVTVRNDGNVHIRPRGKVVIKDGKGKMVKELALPYGYPIMPQQSYTYNVSWKDHDFSWGRYQADASIQYGKVYELNKTHEAQTSFSVK